jgi:predicted MPP superfamily phosphohydrolase
MGAPSRRSFLAGALVAAVELPRLARAEGRGNPQEHFEVTETELRVRGLDPAHDGLRIVQLSDIHVGDCAPDGRVLAAVKAANAAKPDLVFLTGDYVTWARDPIEHLPLVLSGLEAPVHAVLGNHDHFVDARGVAHQLEKMGYAVLQNQHTMVRAKGADLALIGIGDGTTRHDLPELAFKGAPTTGTRLVLAHSPPTAKKLPPDSNLVCFSGHTHGGQIQIPILTKLAMRLARQPYVRGLYAVNGNQLYVNRGLGFGTGTPMARVGSDPEVSVFTLRVA